MVVVRPDRMQIMERVAKRIVAAFSCLWVVGSWIFLGTEQNIVRAVFSISLLMIDNKERTAE